MSRARIRKRRRTMGTEQLEAEQRVERWAREAPVVEAAVRGLACALVARVSVWPADRHVGRLRALVEAGVERWTAVTRCALVRVPDGRWARVALGDEPPELAADRIVMAVDALLQAEEVK